MKKSFITQEYLLKNYTNGTQTVKEIATKLGCANSTVFRALKRFNIPTRPKKEISKKELETLYLEQKYTIAKIAKDFSFSETHVNNLIKKYNIETRKYSYLYNQDDSFFNIPNTKNCYWAGFIAADGCIGDCRGKEFLAINLKNTDKEILESFKKQTQFTGKILDGKHNGYGKYLNKIYYYCSIQIRNCQQWIDDLKKHWNITKAKSLTIMPPNINDNNLQLNYIIGLIDGDGCISIVNNKICFQLIGTKELMSWCSTILHKLEDQDKYYPLTVNKKKNGNYYYINCSSIRAYNLLIELNKVETPHRLARKWDKIKEYELNNSLNGCSNSSHK